MIFKPKYFKIQELVDPDTLTRYGEDYCWKTFFDKRLLIQIDLLREYFGKPITINNWNEGGEFKYRGFRQSNCTVGATNSQHRFGRAVDFDVQGLTADEVRKEICKFKYLPSFKFISRMEDLVTWVHIDCANTTELELFKG
jgi:hypothetical protein